MLRLTRRLLLPVLPLLMLFTTAPAHAQDALPPQGPPPPGSNDFDCKPPPRHPYPVVLVHGTYEDMIASWNAMAPALTRLGYCVFALDYGNNATGEISQSARQVNTFVGRVLDATGASKVALVGHSQGGMLPRYLVKSLGRASQVDDLVGLAPSNHGTDNALAGPAAAAGCVACGQQITGSPFLTELNAGEEAPAPVSYTSVATRFDQVVTPYQSAFLAGPAERVTNVTLQDRCPADQTEHLGIQYDPVAIQWVLAALGRPGPADPEFAPDCSGVGLASFPDSDSTSGSGPSTPAGDSGSSNGRRLAIGFVPRHASVTRRRRLRVAVSTRGSGRVRRVVVTVRRARGGGKRLGRSRPRALRGRQAVVVRLIRPLRPGRYVVRATGSGVRAVSRRFTLR
jgi:triacylglycerol lipase